MGKGEFRRKIRVGAEENGNDLWMGEVKEDTVFSIHAQVIKASSKRLNIKMFQTEACHCGLNHLHIMGKYPTG